MVYFWIWLVSFLAVLLFCILGFYFKETCRTLDFLVCTAVLGFGILLTGGGLEIIAAEPAQVTSSYVKAESYQEPDLNSATLMTLSEESSENPLGLDDSEDRGIEGDGVKAVSDLDDAEADKDDGILLIPLDGSSSFDGENTPVLDVEEMPIKDSLPAGSISESEYLAAIRQDLYLLVHGMIPLFIAIVVIIAGCFFFWKTFFDV